MPSASDTPHCVDVEVLICTHNRVALLERTLASLNACRRPADEQVGLFVVANACGDGTHEFLEGYVRALPQLRPVTGYPPYLTEDPDRLPLRWIEVPQPGKSHALNVALPQAAAPVIAFVDDDHRVDEGYLVAACSAARRYRDADLFCGRILPDWDGGEPEWVHDEGPYRIYPLPVPRFELGIEEKPVTPGVATPGGGNLAIRRALFERVGPFRLELGPQGHDLGGAEDIEWVRRAVADGARLYYIPDMLQYHYVDPTRLTLRYLMAKAYERSASMIRLSADLREQRRIPPYMLRKTLEYAALALTSLGRRRRRFYLTRLAAALGEIKGFRLLRRAASRTDSS